MTHNISEHVSANPRLRVCSFESRRGDEMRSLIEKQGASATIAPSMREIPLEENDAVLQFGDMLFAGQIDVMIYLTGVGTRAMLEVLLVRHSRQDIVTAFNRCRNVVRGPKPVVVLKEWGIRIDHRAPEPNTWKELLAVLDEELTVQGQRVAVQEYGKPSTELHVALLNRGADLVTVPVYRWELPEDVRPLQAAIRAVIDGQFDLLMFTSAQQITHVMQVAEELGLLEAWQASASRCAIASIGPTCSDALRDAGLVVDLEPTHPKMGWLVREAIADGNKILSRKRTGDYTVDDEKSDE